MTEEEAQESHARLSAWWAVREVDQLFGRFKRYTQFVAYSKWVLLGVAGILTTSLILWPLVTKDKSGIRVSFVDSKTAKAPPTSPVMDNPEYRGVGDAGQQYKVTGKSALQKTPTLVIIDTVEAQMVKDGGGWNALTADRAEYQQDKKLIDLYGNVNVIDEKGTSFTTSHATIEMPSMHTYGTEPITGVGPMGNILASGFEITDKGNHIVFTGGAKQLTVHIDRDTAQKSGNKKK